MFEQTTKVQIDLQIFPNFRKSAKVPHGPWSQDQTFPRLWDRPVCEFGMICTLFCKKPVRVMKLDPPSSNIQDNWNWKANPYLKFLMKKRELIIPIIVHTYDFYMIWLFLGGGHY